MSLREIASSLARAGVRGSWRKPAESLAEVKRLRARLTVLAAAWRANAVQARHRGTAAAWKDACGALDELLETDGAAGLYKGGD